jgi:hypothetical protein
LPKTSRFKILYLANTHQRKKPGKLFKKQNAQLVSTGVTLFEKARWLLTLCKVSSRYIHIRRNQPGFSKYVKPMDGEQQ